MGTTLIAQPIDVISVWCHKWSQVPQSLWWSEICYFSHFYSQVTIISWLTVNSAWLLFSDESSGVSKMVTWWLSCDCHSESILKSMSPSLCDTLLCITSLWCHLVTHHKAAVILESPNVSHMRITWEVIHLKAMQLHTGITKQQPLKRNNKKNKRYHFFFTKVTVTSVTRVAAADQWCVHFFNLLY